MISQKTFRGKCQCSLRLIDFGLHCMACGTSVAQVGTEHTPSALNGRVLTTG